MSSTPIWAIGEPSGPMLNGITYIVRPLIQPSKKLRRVSFISLGCIQLLVGPASVLFKLQIKVRSSTHAPTSLGSERARKLFGRFSGFRRRKVPAFRTICSHTDHIPSGNRRTNGGGGVQKLGHWGYQRLILFVPLGGDHMFWSRAFIIIRLNFCPPGPGGERLDFTKNSVCSVGVDTPLHRRVTDCFLLECRECRNGGSIRMQKI